MKKALSVLLSMLVIFSMVGVMAFAEGENTEKLVEVIFYADDGETVLRRVQIPEGTNLSPYEPEENPSKPDTETTEYIFKGWDYLEDNSDDFYRPNGLPAAKGETMTFVAVYSENDISGYQSFWNFIESIFERINLLFEYFAEIFQW